MNDTISESKFFMWRAVFAMAHADNVITDEEIAFMAKAFDDINFSEEQVATLKNDTFNPKDIETMFRGITDPKDRTDFFTFARDMVWVDGDYGAEEQSIMLKLMKTHMENVCLDDMVGNVSLELEDDPQKSTNNENSNKQTGVRGMLSAFSYMFSGK